MPTSGKARILKWFAIAAVLLLIVAAALPFVLDANQFRPQIESRLASALGRDVRLGKLRLSIFSGSVKVEDITIADNPLFSQSPFVSAKSLQVSIELKPLIFDKSVLIQGITLDHPAITLISAKSGQWNFSDLGSGNAAQKQADTGKPAGLGGNGLSIKKLEITGGQVTLIHEGRNRKPSIYNNVNIQVRNLSSTTEFPFILSASLPGEGTLKLEGKAGPFNHRDMSMTPLAAELEVKHFDLLASGFSGTASGLRGIFDFNGNVQSNGSEVRSKGKASANGLRITGNGSPANKAVSLQYAMDYSLLRRAGNLGDSSVQIGKAVAHLSGSYEMQENGLSLKTTAHGARMPVEDLTALFPAFGITLPKGADLKGGTLNANLTAEGPAEKLLTTGTVEMVDTRLTGFDLSGKMAALATLAGLKSSQETRIEVFSSALSMSPEGIQVKDLLLVAPALGRLSGNGNIAADETLNFSMKALLKPAGGIGSELMRITKGDSLDVPFFIRGTASNPKFVPDVKHAVGGLLGSVAGQGSKDSKTGTNESLQNTIRGLFKKK